jgi:hypothetical protein
VTPLHLINKRRVAFGKQGPAAPSATGFDVEAITRKVIELIKNMQ